MLATVEPRAPDAGAVVVPAPVSERHLCDLCYRYRPHQLRAWGVRTIDYYWACALCAWAYVKDLEINERVFRI